MYKLCKTEQSAARQRMLEAGLLQAMNTQRYEDISISDLCDQLAVPRKSFYRYFSSKDGALHALVDHALMEYELFFPETYDKEHRTFYMEMERFFLFWKKQKDLLDALTKSSLSGVLIERSINHALQETVMPTRFLLQDTPEMQRQITAFCVCGMLSIVFGWHQKGFDSSAGQMAVIATRLLGAPLFPGADLNM